MMAGPRPNALSWLGLSAVLVAVDQWSKWLAVSRLEYGNPVPFIDGFWNWTLVHNYGAAFSFLSSAGGWQRWFFTALAIVISTGLVVWLARTPRSDWRSALPFALIIAGAIGNVIDRIRYGYVVDFVDWYVGTWHWPAFNVADSAIVVGAALLVVLSFKSPDTTGKGG
ncbi:signal peptidase II [Arenimonas sp.]|uniref:signal peptidase II n=1 Tax=Arenimonas sp. TaxID=1872635 RepID=UPI0035B0D716